MDKDQLYVLAKAKEKAEEIFRHRVSPAFVFHNIAHTQQVVDAAAEIAADYHLKPDDEFVLVIAAWFHDAGFSKGLSENHEEESICIAQEFLFQHHISEELIVRISSCILATKMPQQPLNLVGEILCDADLYHLGTNFFMERSRLLQKELASCSHNIFKEEKWRQLNIRFLQSHHYFTAYCQNKLTPVKRRWIEQLRLKKSDTTTQPNS